jgi:hypothetical protein
LAALKALIIDRSFRAESRVKISTNHSRRPKASFPLNFASTTIRIIKIEPHAESMNLVVGHSEFSDLKDVTGLEPVALPMLVVDPPERQSGADVKGTPDRRSTAGRSDSPPPVFLNLSETVRCAS